MFIRLQSNLSTSYINKYVRTLILSNDDDIYDDSTLGDCKYLHTIILRNNAHIGSHDNFPASLRSLIFDKYIAAPIFKDVCHNNYLPYQMTTYNYVSIAGDYMPLNIVALHTLFITSHGYNLPWNMETLNITRYQVDGCKWCPPLVKHLDIVHCAEYLPTSITSINYRRQDLGSYIPIKIYSHIHTELRKISISNESINCSDLPNSIDVLSLYSCSITELTRLPMHVTHIDVRSCNLGYIPQLAHLPLITLMVCRNMLRTLPELPSSLKVLYCSNNMLTELPELPRDMRLLLCAYNGIISIVLRNCCIDWLLCCGNPIAELILDNVTCYNFDCSNVATTQIALPSMLTTLVCNDIDGLRVLPSHITELGYESRYPDIHPPIINTNPYLYSKPRLIHRTNVTIINQYSLYTRLYLGFTNALTNGLAAAAIIPDPARHFIIRMTAALKYYIIFTLRPIAYIANNLLWLYRHTHLL
jgi:hypothetical protein